MQSLAQRVSVRPLAGLRVVIVDDERVSLMAITAMLGSWGASIQAAGGAADALRLIADTPPDLVVCDLYMPDMDGFEMMKRVRELPAASGGRTPAIAITAHPSFDSRREAERAGFGAVFSKPFARDELIETMLRLSEP